MFWLDTNECDSNPCLNGGTCADSYLTYSCKCVPGYTGFICETGKQQACIHALQEHSHRHGTPRTSHSSSYDLANNCYSRKLISGWSYYYIIVAEGHAFANQKLQLMGAWAMAWLCLEDRRSSCPLRVNCLLLNSERIHWPTRRLISMAIHTVDWPRPHIVADNQPREYKLGFRRTLNVRWNLRLRIMPSFVWKWQNYDLRA